MDYITESLNFQYQLEKEFSLETFIRLEKESDFIEVCIENMRIVMEDTSMSVTNKKNIFARFIEFIKRIFKMFTDKGKDNASKNSDWLTEAEKKLQKHNFDGIEVELLPLWLHSPKEAYEVAKRLVIKDVTETTVEDGDMEKFKQNHYKEFLDENGDFTNGIKNLYRTGKATGPNKMVKLSGDKLKDICIKEFIPYCKNYKAYCNDFKMIIGTYEYSLTKYDKFIKDYEDKESEVKENFLLIENVLLTGAAIGIFPVTEDTKHSSSSDSKPEKKSVDDNKENTADNKKEGSTGVTVTKKEIKPSNPNTKYGDLKASESFRIRKNEAALKQTAIAAVLTVSEERYATYMSTLKQVLSK